MISEIASDAASASAAYASAVAAMASAVVAFLSLTFAIVIHLRASRGKAVVTWRFREPGVPVIDVVARNAGASPLYDLEVHVPRLEKPIVVPVLSPGNEVIIDTLGSRDAEQTYIVTAMRSPGSSRRREKATTTISPKSLTGVKLGGPLPLRRIATVFERLEKNIGDEPDFRDAIPRIGISRVGEEREEEEWLLPRGVRGVLLPSPTHRQGIHTDTELGDTWVRRAANDEVVHQPQQVLRIVMDETVTEEERARIRSYLKLGSEVTFHWHRRGPDAELSYIVEGESVMETPAMILKRTVKFVERESSNGAEA